MALTEHVVGDLGSLLAYALTLAGDVRWFRGQGCATRDLRPSLIRRLAPVTPARLLTVESRLLTRFRQRSLPFWPEGYPQDDWEHLFAMQHFGVPTRLLDWSENLLTAAFFAADHIPGRCECGGSCEPAVWILRPVLLNRNNSRLDGYGDAIGVLATSDSELEVWAPSASETRFAPWPVAIYGTHNSVRIAAQQGTFTVAGKEDRSLEHVPAVTDNDDVLTKVTLNLPHESLMRQLRALGVTRSAVYPDLSALALDITDAEDFT